ncbi:MAG TPA: polysaccharide deacetylase [Candidatus Borkfalkia excrementigallinarum]|uniref:Polysaccharide deacetylase n=1 Tax=Candidatus Borkfalkia excrementigallinarum TaxID=2838506 RepID=A0A9D2CT27_9FIRM|nr:polysaccharide deacetylase [Candidatus Borkfalkia excrementigallinarum]
MKKIAIFLLCTVLLLGGACRQEQKPAADSAGKNGIPAQSEYPAQNHAADTHAEKTIYLTFDDGPTDSTTPKILDILKNENVKATFFVIGRQISGREKILFRESAEGHAIGIHTQTHEYKKIYDTEETLLADIRACKASIRKVFPDFETDLYRFPGGSFGVKKELIAAVEKAGYRHYDWNASAEDAVSANASAEDLYNNVLLSAGNKKNVILLMHDGVGYKSTIACLPSVIRHFRSGGYTFSTLKNGIE